MILREKGTKVIAILGAVASIALGLYFVIVGYLAITGGIDSLSRNQKLNK